MKRALIIFLSFLMLLLAGCSGKSTGHSMSEVKNVMTEKFGYEWEELSEHTKNWYHAEEAESAVINGWNYKDADFDSFYCFVFSSDKKAESFLDYYKNENKEYTDVTESGKDFCYLDDSSYCDAYGEIYIYRKDNVIFLLTEVYGCWYSSEEEAQQINDSNSSRREAYLDFCKNDLPKIAEALG